MALGRTVMLADGNVMPSLGFGTYPMRGREAVKAIDQALATGYRKIDTAAMYGNEAEVGQAVRESGMPREEIFVTTKLHGSDHGYEPALKAGRKSLDELGLDYIDLYLIHWPATRKRLETWRALMQLKEEGVCRSIGVSNYSTSQVQELLDEFHVSPVVNQVEFHPASFPHELLRYCRKHRIVVEAYTPLAHGRLLRNRTIRAVAQAHEKTPAQVILRWELEHGAAPIPKASSEDHIRENFGVWDFSLTDEEVRQIDAV